MHVVEIKKIFLYGFKYLPAEINFLQNYWPKMATKGRKKITVDFTADNIDSTAPVNKILDELQHRNPQAYMFYGQVLRPKRTIITHANDHCTLPGYPINAFDDDWDGELNLDYFEPFTFKSQPPKMITPMQNVDKTDPVTKLLRDKIEWHRTAVNLKRIASFINVIDKYETLNEEVVQCPKHLVEIAAHLDSDPDPYFDAAYNWYYSGSGNLQLVCIDWVDYLLHSEFTEVYLSEFSKNNVDINTEPVSSFDCGEQVLETIYSENIVVLRTKHKVFILKLLKTDDTFTFEKLKCIKSELPYTSVAFDNFHNNILYVTSLDQKLSIINLDRLKARTIQLKGKLTTLVDNWNSVISSERGFYVHAARHYISIYDKRSNNISSVWKDLRNISDMYTCNDISVAKHFQENNLLYFGTDHHLFLMDLRYSLKSEPKVVQRWTHGMECVPTYLNYCNFEFNKDLICLSSQWCEDMCVVPNYIDKLIKDTDSGGVTIPYRPPSIRDALSEARQKLLCHDLYNPIDSRLCTSITGLLLIEQGENYVILMQNSLGDISCHSLFPEHFESFIEDDSAQKLHEWSEKYVLDRKDFEVSSIENIASIWKKLRKIPDDFKINDDLVEQKCKFDENEIREAFEEEEVDVGLQDAWKAPAGTDETLLPVDESQALNLHYSDEEISQINKSRNSVRFPDFL